MRRGAALPNVNHLLHALPHPVQEPPNAVYARLDRSRTVEPGELAHDIADQLYPAQRPRRPQGSPPAGLVDANLRGKPT